MSTTLSELLRCIDDANDDGSRAFELIAELTETGGRSIAPDLVNALRTYVMNKNPYGRDMIAAAYAEVEGIGSLPILLRASSVDMGDDQESLQSTIVDVISLDPSRALKVVEELEADSNPRIKPVAAWAREMVSFVADS